MFTIRIAQTLAARLKGTGKIVPGIKLLGHIYLDLTVLIVVLDLLGITHASALGYAISSAGFLLLAHGLSKAFD